MRRSRQTQIRALLRASPDGLTTGEIASRVDGSAASIHRTLQRMPDTYIDRWVRREDAQTRPLCAVWCAVVPPDNCPRPT